MLHAAIRSSIVSVAAVDRSAAAYSESIGSIDAFGSEGSPGSTGDSLDGPDPVVALLETHPAPASRPVTKTNLC
jgi:hypothetical protein